jgi:hypothetical protein
MASPPAGKQTGFRIRAENAALALGPLLRINNSCFSPHPRVNNEEAVEPLFCDIVNLRETSCLSHTTVHARTYAVLPLLSPLNQFAGMIFNDASTSAGGSFTDPTAPRPIKPSIAIETKTTPWVEQSVE